MSFSFILLGILIGFISGMFGVGGSIITTPVLKIVFGIPDLIALASPLPVTIPTAISGVSNYWQKKIIRTKIAFLTIIGGLPATVAGALGTKFVKSSWLMVLTGVFIVIVGFRLFYNTKLKQPQVQHRIPTSVLAVFIGIITGIFSGLLAIGGGVIMVPAFVLMLGLSMQEAASTSLLCIAFFAIPGTLVHWKLNHIDWNLVLNLSIGVIPSSYLGSKVGILLKSRQLQMIFSIFLILFGLYFIFLCIFKNSLA